MRTSATTKWNGQRHDNRHDFLVDDTEAAKKYSRLAFNIFCVWEGYESDLQLSRLWLEYFRFVVGILRSPGESSEAELLLT